MIRLALSIAFLAVVLGCVEVHRSRLLTEAELRAKYWQQYEAEGD